jgi:Spy/CpxP family protein refolding chaperone
MKTTACLLTFCAFALLRATAAPNPIESEFFPPDFLFSQHEALGLNETQIKDLQAIVQDVQPKFESLKGQLEERVKTLQDALHQPNPDIPKTEEKLRAMLSQENEMKALQLHLLLTLRGKLTPEQVDKARQLRAQTASTSTSGDPTNGLRERLQAKFEQLKTAVEAQAAGGQPPEETVAKAREIQQLVQDGKPQEAENQLDALLATMPNAKAKP